MSKPVISGFVQEGRPLYMLEALFVPSSSCACCFCFAFLVSPCFTYLGTARPIIVPPLAGGNPRRIRGKTTKQKTTPPPHVVTYIQHNNFWTWEYSILLSLGTDFQCLLCVEIEAWELTLHRMGLDLWCFAFDFHKELNRILLLSAFIFLHELRSGVHIGIFLTVK
jgi:hypothetical protein